jgi:nitrite reductase/ring-hydroxylating ferredoxin subunit
MFKRGLVYIVSVMFLFTSCGKENSFVPDVYVNKTLTVQQFRIDAVNNVVLLPNVGVAGILIYFTGTRYVAYDRCSPVHPENLCKVAPDHTGITVEDPCTGAKWLLLDGSPQKAPAVKNLKEYSVSIQGGQIIQISN